MANLEEFQLTKEYKLWCNLREVCESLEINESKMTSMKDLCDYWEPFLERIFKLGVLFKQNGKLKEIKSNWIRPIFCVETGDKITIDGRTYEPTKESIDKAGDCFRALRALVAAIYEIDKLDPVNYKKLKKGLQDSSSAFFKVLNFFVSKKCAQELHGVIKTIIRPLRDLVKANFRLFLLEKKEEGDSEITLFQDKKDLKLFTENLNQYFIDEEIKLKRDIDMEVFDDFLNKNLSKAYYQYNFYSKQRENFTNNNENVNLKKQILQKKYEEGLQALLKYLYDKKKDDFYIEINVNKLFRNLEIVPQGYQLKSTKFFLGQMQNYMKELKERLYEIKINGTTRIKMPITENTELIQKIKKIYDLHLVIDNLMGDKLKYDQFIFIYNCITFVVESNIKEEISIFKEKNFMEDAIPKYIILSALKNGVMILNQMKAKMKELNENFTYDSFYQIKNLKLGSEDNYIINAFEINESLKKLMNPELQEISNKLHSEIEEFGSRFWILEEFFDSQDTGLWLEAIDHLKDINFSVIDDIRDFILTNYEHSNNQQADDYFNSGKKETRKEMRKVSSIKLASQKSVKKLKDNIIKSPLIKPKKSNKKLTIGLSNLNGDNKPDKSDSEEDSILINNTRNLLNNINLDNFRPPFVWNFPIELITKKIKDENKKAEVRNVDPKNFYKDGRVTQFLEILTKIKTKMIDFCKNSKTNKWLYFFENILKIHSITYSFPEKTLIINNKKHE